jgi:hypothetical protein
MCIAAPLMGLGGISLAGKLLGGKKKTVYRDRPDLGPDSSAAAKPAPVLATGGI